MDTGCRSTPYAPGDPSRVLQAVQATKPVLVGLSVIFQYTIDGLAELAGALREAGCPSHITVGGHFPSMRPREVLEHIPAIDSVVCFEGELTALELLRNIDRPEAWGRIKGLAYRRKGEIWLTPPRPLVADLDDLPWPVRGQPRRLSRGVKAASIAASRGCWYDCSFCSVRQFYGSAPGSLRRSRSPTAVVDEMSKLHQRDGVGYFVFQDDDFAAKTPNQQAWVNGSLDEMATQSLVGKVAWRMACRADEIVEPILRRCQEHGLVLVYVGFDAGSEVGAQRINKRATLVQSLAAVEALKRLGLAFEMGFMQLFTGQQA